MKLPKLTKKAMVIAAASGLAVGTAGIAAAYFAIGGSGTGSASVGTPSAVTITGTALSGVGPGTAYHVGFTADNGNTYNVDLGAVSISKVTVTSSKSLAGCKATWFTMAAASTALGTLTPGANAIAATTATKTPTIELKTLSTNESACEGATLTLTFTAPAG